MERLIPRVTHRISDVVVTKSQIIVGGIISQVKKIITKKSGQEMAFVKIDDMTAIIEVVVFPSIYEKTKNIWQNDRVILVKGKVSEKEDRLTVIADDAKLLDIKI